MPFVAVHESVYGLNGLTRAVRRCLFVDGRNERVDRTADVWKLP